ncbi:Uncharacterised protein [Chlamydia trachomatis]|nr:Uncharacterised protein [Chlamydia trachomatis]
MINQNHTKGGIEHGACKIHGKIFGGIGSHINSSFYKIIVEFVPTYSYKDGSDGSDKYHMAQLEMLGDTVAIEK